LQRGASTAGGKTGIGRVVEPLALPALKRGGYEIKEQVEIGLRLGGGKHKVDILARNTCGQAFLISLKLQQVSGTAEQKVPFEAMCLAQAVHEGNGMYTRAYIVLGGDGWKPRQFFIGDRLKAHLTFSNLVNIVSLESFAALANGGRL
jgi:hypothetical protein